ncbi:MAG: hypothetical protein LJE83_14030 [Gammaproteobacteria bacterium]|nr:hypothetical protein [Gammaproteobacteria bacterium]
MTRRKTIHGGSAPAMYSSIRRCSSAAVNSFALTARLAASGNEKAIIIL